MDIEQLQAELATAVRGNDILRCEVEHAVDNISSMNHKLKDLELQVSFCKLLTTTIWLLPIFAYLD